MKRYSLFLFLCLALAALGLSSCDTYVDAGYAGRPVYRPGYAFGPGFGPGFGHPGFAPRPGYAYNRNYYNAPTRGYHSTPSRSYYRPSSYRGRNDHDHGRRDWNNNSRNWDRSRYYRGSGGRTNTRVNVGPVGLSNANRLRF